MNKELIHNKLLELAAIDKLTASEVVKEAESPTSPLHGLFEWDDSEAAFKYRLQQAREVIASFDITVTINRVEINVQEFVRDPTKDQDAQGYVPVTSIQCESDEAREFVLRELTTARSYVNRAERFAMMLGINKDIHILSNRLEQLADSLTNQRPKRKSQK